MRGPALLVCALVALLSSAPAAAEVVVSACADVGAGVEVGAQTAFPITLHRDPTLATAARLDFTAYDPDNLNGVVEVEVDIDPAAYAVPELQSLLLGNENPAAFDSRSVTYSVDIPTTALVLGANTVVMNDLDDVSVFTIERVCLTLIDAPPSATPPPAETFCTDDVVGPDPTVPGETFDDGSWVLPGGTATFDLDVYLTNAAKVGLDVVTFVSANDSGDHTAGFADNVETLTTTFAATNAVKNDQYVVTLAPVASGLLVGSLDGVPVTTSLTAEGAFTGRYWSACLVVEDTFLPPEPDAGPVVEDAGPPGQDAGILDAGPPADAGAPGPTDAGPVGGDSGPTADAGGPVTQPNDAGPLLPESDSGDSEADGDPRADGEAPEGGEAEARARAELTNPSFGVSSSCAAVGDLPVLASLLLLAIGARRRRRISRT